MPEPALPNMALVLPTEGGDAGVYDEYLNDALTLVDSHDHSTGKGVKVKTNGIDVNADLTFASGGSYSAITNVKGVDFQPHAASAMTAYAGCLFTNSSDANNLYFRTQAGSNVRITNGAALDTTTSGGIGGDYAAIPAEVAYIDASDTYTFRQTAAGNWARLQSGSVRIAETGTTEAVYVELACPAALASSYTITPATALPGSTQLVQISSAGALTYTNTVTNAVTLSGGIANNVTLTLGATAASNQHVTVSGTGEYKHGNRTLVLSPFSGDGTMTPSGVVDAVTAGGAGGTWKMSIPLSVGDRIRSVQFYYQRQAGTLTFALRNVVLSTGVGANVSSTTVNSGTSYTSVTLSSIDHTLVSTNSYHLSFTSGGTDDLYAAVVTWDHP